MRVEAASGAVGLGGGPRDLVLEVPELGKIADIETRSVFHRDSADLRPEDWVVLADAVHQAFDDGADGIVVAHGTDTMAYGATFVSFLLGPLPGPVVFTGAQRPLSEVRSDARTNLIDATIAATLDVPEVCIAFDSKVLRAVRTTKLDAWAFDAFASPTLPPLVRLGLDVAVGGHVRKPSALGPLDRRFEPKVLFVRVFPGLDPAMITGALQVGARGLVLSTYGTGTLPSREGSLLPAVQEARERDVPVLVISQCPSGFVDLSRYEAGTKAAQLGAIGGRELSVEAAIAKMMVALGRFNGADERRAYLEANVLGEVD
jgi:L-asparaginase